MSPDGAAAFAQSLGDGHIPHLWITALASPSLTNGGAALCVTPSADSRGGVDPKRLSEMRVAARSFLESHEGGVLIIDCLDLLAEHNGVERVVRAIEGIHDDATTMGGILVVFVDPRTASPRLIAWLERELEDVRLALPGQPSSDVLVA